MNELNQDGTRKAETKLGGAPMIRQVLEDGTGICVLGRKDQSRSKYSGSGVLLKHKPLRVRSAYVKMRLLKNWRLLTGQHR